MCDLYLHEYIFDIHSVAHHIWDLKIDERLGCGDYMLVNFNEMLSLYTNSKYNT